MREIVLEARALAAGYDGKAAVKDISFAVRRGEILTLIGPNGAGKSTLLKALARQLKPLAGAVLLGGEPMEAMPANALARRVSLLTTGRVRTEKTTVRDVVSLGRYPYTGTLGLLTQRDRAVVDETMEKARVADIAERDFEALSDGQRQRVLLARAICQEPEVLLLDEPTSYLDVRYKLELLTLLRELARERDIAVVLSLHELALARRISDTVLCVRDGAADRVGKPEEIFAGGYVDALYGMPDGSYAAYFGGEETKDGKAYAFFRNTACEKFPCHTGVPREAFNCLFCYCPLYALGERCGGNFHYTARGVKSCVDCDFPHVRAHYDAVLARWPELAELTRGKNGDGV